MSKTLGALVLVAGVTGLGFWGANSHAFRIENQIATAAATVVAEAVHPMELSVSGRDITLAGTADTQAELNRIVDRLVAVRGRRVVQSKRAIVLPEITPYETALAKAADGVVATGYVPSAAQRDALTEMLPALIGLPLGHGAPSGWRDAVAAGNAALAALDEGSFALTGTTVTLQGVAATPTEDAAARGALAGLDGFDTVSAIKVTDPGQVDFTLSYDAAQGYALQGIVPRDIGTDGIADALGRDSIPSEVGTTFAALPGLSATLERLHSVTGLLDSYTVTGRNEGITIDGVALAGLDDGIVFGQVALALGSTEGLTVDQGLPPADASERLNVATGARQIAHGGNWLTLPDFEPTKADCAVAATETVAVAPIQFFTGSAELDPISLPTINNIAGIVHLCTRDDGMRVTIGGHTDAQGDDVANYKLSVARAKAVRDALIARGVAPHKMTAMGFGATEPIADNETEEGRAQNRRTTFAWPD